MKQKVRTANGRPYKVHWHPVGATAPVARVSVIATTAGDRPYER